MGSHVLEKLLYEFDNRSMVQSHEAGMDDNFLTSTLTIQGKRLPLSHLHIINLLNVMIPLQKPVRQGLVMYKTIIFFFNNIFDN